MLRGTRILTGTEAARFSGFVEEQRRFLHRPRL